MNTLLLDPETPILAQNDGAEQLGEAHQFRLHWKYEWDLQKALLMNTDQAVRNHVLALLDGGQAHMSYEDVVADFPADKINVKPPNVPYTPWHLIEHLRITQWDILDYTRNPNYVAISWPTDYWPEQDAKTDMAGWQKTIDQFLADLAEMRAIVADPKTDLTAPIPYAEHGHTVLREALLLADHNAYHIGELGILRQVMDAWPK
jgi:hypothetical protein